MDGSECSKPSVSADAWLFDVSSPAALTRLFRYANVDACIHQLDRTLADPVWLAARQPRSR